MGLCEADTGYFLRGLGETARSNDSVVLSLGVLTGLSGSRRAFVNDLRNWLPDAVAGWLCLVGAVCRGYTATERGLTASQDLVLGCLRVGLAGGVTGAGGKGDTSSASLRSGECSVAGSVSGSSE